jgi:predicted dehydrogenase
MADLPRSGVVDCRRHPAASGPGTSSAAELVAAGNIDIVHIRPPNYLHAGPVEWVICEKPLSTHVGILRGPAALAAGGPAHRTPRPLLMA